MFLCVVCCDCWRFDTISGCLGVHHSVFCGAAGLSFSCPGVFVIRILAVVLGEENFVRMIPWQTLQPLQLAGCDSHSVGMLLLVYLLECTVQWSVCPVLLRMEVRLASLALLYINLLLVRLFNLDSHILWMFYVV
jgi:hypothetical protein